LILMIEWRINFYFNLFYIVLLVYWINSIYKYLKDKITQTILYNHIKIFKITLILFVFSFLLNNFLLYLLFKLS
jgi:hypothetical protein